MNHLLIVAHGSRREASNEEIRFLANHLRTITNPFDNIDCAFLEIAEPSIPDGLRHQIALGAKKIVVLPYFLSAGRHVAIDIPEQVDQVAKEASHVEMTIAPYLGSSKKIGELMMQQAIAGLGI